MYVIGTPVVLDGSCISWMISPVFLLIARKVLPPAPGPASKPGPKTRHSDADIVVAIRAILAACPFHGEGYRKVRARLAHRGLSLGGKRVLRLMRTDNLLCLRRRAFIPATTDSRHEWQVVPNLARGMQVTGLDQLWVADITYLRLLEEFAFLAVVLDAFSRRVVGWAVEIHLRAALAVAALEMALATRRPRPGQLVHHSDRGVQYACAEYSALLAAHGIQPSMSRIGSPYDNAKAESFMSTLKREEVDGRAYRTAQEARRSIGSFIEEVYNRQRLHSALSYLAPADFEATVAPMMVLRPKQPAVSGV